MNKQSNNNRLDRRSFLKVSTLAGGGLLVGVNWLAACRPENGAAAAGMAAAEFIELNAYVKIAANGLVTLMASSPELGQGIRTAIPMIVAEELDADWSKVVVEQAPLDTRKYERQVAGGSYAIRGSWDTFRKAGATIRHMLMQAAAKRWETDPAQCTTSTGFVVHPDGKQKLGYGELAGDAAQMEIPEEVPLKNPEDYRIIGSRFAAVDIDDIITGKAVYGQDIRRESMLHAMVVRPPAFGQQLKSVDDERAKGMPGIRHVLAFDNKVAIVGDTTWQVKKGRDALRITWEDPAQLDNTEAHVEQFRALIAREAATPLRQDGDAERALRQAKTIVEGVYEAPFLPHNPMEPMNFFAHVQGDKVELVGPTQTPARARGDVARMLDIPEDNITVEMSYQGGGFGRRLSTDFALDAAKVSSLIDAPVLVAWTREDDMCAGVYRPAAMYSYQAGLDENGELIAWRLRSAGASTNNATLPNNFPAGAVPNFQVEFHRLDSHVTTGAWRAPNHNFVAYAEESFLDEIAHAAGKDPVQFRLELLDRAANQPAGNVEYDVERYRRVIEKAAEVSRWGQSKGEGVFQGFSAHFSYGSYVAQVAEVSVSDGDIQVRKVYSVIDCGTVINYSGAENQSEGGIIDGVGHALFGEQPIRNGIPANRNFDSYRLIKMRETPKEIETHFVNLEARPEGLGEPTLPPAAGAVANAVFAATGQRLRKQPFVQTRLLG
jgi:isoquinoline 1-oxidoreductase beta subunit